VDLSPSGRWCIATQSKGVRIWDLNNEAAETFIPSSDMQSVRITPDETALYVCRHQSLERWPFLTNATGVKINLAAAQRVALPEGKGARGISLSLDGSSALVELTDLRLAVINLAGQAPPVFLAESSRQPSLRTPGSPTGAGRFTISPDGQWAVTGFGVGAQDHPMVWDAKPAGSHHIAIRQRHRRLQSRRTPVGRGGHSLLCNLDDERLATAQSLRPR
jgi:hypothetical protein